jgi:hypothetical protein
MKKMSFFDDWDWDWIILVIVVLVLVVAFSEDTIEAPNGFFD